MTGAFGYTGRYIARRLLAAGRRVRNLTGHPDRPSPFGPEAEGALEVRPLDFRDPAALRRALDGVEVLYNTYWIRFPRGGVDHDVAFRRCQALFRAAEEAGVRHVVHVSITGADPRSPLPYFRGKGLTEEALAASRLSWTIVRPTLVFGPEDVLLHNLAWLLRRLPVFAVMGDGRYRVRPVHVEDVADLAVRAGAGAYGPAARVDAVGPETYTYLDLVRRIAEAVGRRPPILHLPPDAVWLAGCALGLLVGDVVVTRHELRGLMAGLLHVDGPPTGQRRLSDWLRAHGPDLGRTWVSELRRHYLPG